MNDGIYVSPWVVVLLVALAAATVAFVGGRATASHPNALSASEVQEAVDVGMNRATDKIAQRFVNEVVSNLQNATIAAAENDAGAADIRVTIPSVEGYFADHGTYEGISVGKLRTNYDQSVPSTIKIVSATSESYCVEATHGSQTWFKAGPSAQIEPGSCP